MGLVDDFLANNTPTIPPTQQEQQREETPKLQAGDPPRLTQAEYDLHKFRQTENSDLPLLGAKYDASRRNSNILDLLVNLETSGKSNASISNQMSNLKSGTIIGALNDLNIDTGEENVKLGGSMSTFETIKNAINSNKLQLNDEYLTWALDIAMGKISDILGMEGRAGTKEIYEKLLELDAEQTLKDNNSRLSIPDYKTYETQKRNTYKINEDKQRNINEVNTNKNSIIETYANQGMPREEAMRLVNNIQSGKKLFTPETVVNNLLPRGMKLDPIKMVDSYVGYGKEYKSPMKFIEPSGLQQQEIYSGSEDDEVEQPLFDLVKQEENINPSVAEPQESQQSQIKSPMKFIEPSGLQQQEIYSGSEDDEVEQPLFDLVKQEENINPSVAEPQESQQSQIKSPMKFIEPSGLQQQEIYSGSEDDEVEQPLFDLVKQEENINPSVAEPQESQQSQMSPQTERKLVDLDNLPPQAKNPKMSAYKGKPLDKDNVLFGDEGDESLYTKEYLKKLPKQQQGVNTDTETQTTDIQNANLKGLRPNGLKPNVYDNSIRQKIKEGGVKTETTERIRERTPYAEFEQITPAGKVLEQLRLNPPKPTQDSERMRKMAGIQAISEALRNVVDGVYGSQKAVIVPHKTYTNEFLKEAKNADAVQAKALEKWMKSMNDASKNAMEGYLRYLAQEDKTNIKKIVNTDPEITTTKEVSEGRRAFAPKSGGGGSRAGGGAGGKSPLKITSANSGISYILDDAIANSAFSYITNFSKSGIPLKKFPKEYQQLINDIKTGIIKPTAENMHAFIQFVYDVFPEAGDEFARSIGAVNTQGRQSDDAMSKANRANAKILENKNKKSNTQATTTTPNKNTKGWSWD